MWLLALTQVLHGQANLPIYTDGLAASFQDWSWAVDNLENTSPVYSGTDSISVTTSNYSALWLYNSGLNTAPYTNLSFWINGGPTGGQAIVVQGVIDNGTGEGGYALAPLAANKWVQYNISMAALGVSNISGCNGFWWQLNSSNSAPTFYVDSVQLNASPPPSVIHITANAAQPVRTADSRWFGINTAVWDGDLNTTTTLSELTGAGWDILRFPGGSLSDEYNWQTDTTGTNTWAWATSFTGFAHVATNIGAQAIITVNYGTGTPAEAAAWVKNSNVTNHYGFKYWEIGNELYGTWETDSNTYPNDPYTYATRAQSYIQQMKAADPTIKIGVVVTTGEDSYSNGYNSHPATNSSTHQIHHGWTPVLLSTLKSLGVTPDFAIYHWYPEYQVDNDANLLAGTSNWAGDATNLRGMISNYFGSGGTNIELLCTENNSDSGPPGKQSVSLVNALYYADSFAQLMQTEFNSFVWWDLRNGEETDGDLDASLYGWREYGDLGVMNGQAADLPDRYPAYFSAKLIQYFVRGGDTVLAATTDDASLMTAYSVRRTNGALTMLVVNKYSAASLSGQVALANFTPSPAGTVYSYGEPQDNAAEAGSSNCDVATNNFTASTNFNYTFGPYSLTVFAFAPESPTLAVAPSPPASGHFIVQINGQPGTPYILQSSANLTNWTSVSTNRLVSSSLMVTNSLSGGDKFWRAIWHP